MGTTNNNIFIFALNMNPSVGMPMPQGGCFNPGMNMPFPPLMPSRQSGPTDCFGTGTFDMNPLPDLPGQGLPSLELPWKTTHMLPPGEEAPFDPKTNYYPNFDNNSNIVSHIRATLISNPNFRDFLSRNNSSVDEVTSMITSDSSDATSDDNLQQLNTMMSSEGFFDKEIQEVMLLGNIHKVNTQLPKTKETGTTAQFNALTVTKSALIQQYEKIDPPMIIG